MSREEAPGRTGSRVNAARLALAGVALWCGALVAGPMLRPDLNIVTTHPETYALGAWGPLMRLGYVGFAIAGWSAAFLAARYRAPALLLTVFGVGTLCIGLLPPTDTGGLADQVFPFLQLAPLAFFPAVAWISWRTRRKMVLVLAALAWLLFLPLVFGEPAHGGIINRAADLAMGAWIGVFALTERHRVSRTLR
jgi:hypothetical protein